MEYLTIEEIVNTLQKEKISLGKGDPYNRLRYYTKMGWIPHMIRRKDKNGIVSGHYPNSVIDTLLKIEKLKQEGLDNSEITSKLKDKKYFENKILLKVLAWMDSLKKINLAYIFVLFVLAAFLTELLYFGPKKEIENALTKEQISQMEILDGGVGIFPSNKNETFIPSRKVGPNSKIIITFEGALDPVNNFYISSKESQKGFVLKLGMPSIEDLKFNWIVVEK